MSTMQHGERESLVLRLRDGRSLGYAEYGDPDGKPVFHLHGYPGSRLEGRIAMLAGGLPKVRLIATDRPGMGLSSFKPGRRITDWADDVAELADALGLQKFVVEGVSGGGPYALACAYRMPDRVKAALVVAGVGPMGSAEDVKKMKPGNRLFFRLARISPLLIRIRDVQFRRILRGDRETAMGEMRKELPPADKALLDDPVLAGIMVDETLEAFRQGTRGSGWEGWLYVHPWGFPVGEVKVPVHFWQGDQDLNVPPEMARKMAAAVPGAKLTLIPGEGHISLAFHHLGEILGEATEY